MPVGIDPSFVLLRRRVGPGEGAGVAAPPQIGALIRPLGEGVHPSTEQSQVRWPRVLGWLLECSFRERYFDLQAGKNRSLKLCRSYWVL